MGKKSKNLNKTVNLRESLPNEEPIEHEGGEKLEKTKKLKSNSVSSSDNTNVLSDDINSVKSSKKQKRKRVQDAEVDADSKLEPATGKEVIKSAEDEHNPPNLEVKKKKKKKRHLSDEQEPSEATNSVTNEDQPDVPKKKKIKKNKGNLLPEEQTTQEKEHVDNESEEPESQVQKKPKKPGIVTNGKETQQKNTNDDVSVATKEQKTRSQKKKRTGTAVLNDEESQVTEEDIDKFCDELDEEDNKQYEEWVKLIEANLPPPREND